MTDKILGFYEKYKTYMDLQENILPSLNPVLEDDNIINTLCQFTWILDEMDKLFGRYQ